MAEEELFDFSNLEKASPGNDAFKKLILESFLKSNPADFDHLVESVTHNDGKQTHQWSHKIKGSCRVIGFKRGESFFGQIEVQMIEGEEIDNNSELLNEGRNLLNLAYSGIKDWLSDYSIMSD